MIKNIKEICDERGISMRKLAQEAGITEGTISRWGTHTPSVDKVKKVADYLGVTVDELLKEEPDDSTD